MQSEQPRLGFFIAVARCELTALNKLEKDVSATSKTTRDIRE
jgi:hypothetical protein